MVFEQYQMYCLSYNNEIKRQNMKRRFDSINIKCIFYDGVSFEDSRIKDRNICNSTKKTWSCMYGHLDMINDFYYNTDKQIGIFCEDDIYIHKDFTNVLPKIMNDFIVLNLDVLLLGYLVPYRINENFHNYPLKQPSYNIDCSTYKYHSFPDNVWGTQMYMLSRNQAKYLLDKYSAASGYADSLQGTFSADWTLTKEGNRALITPILAIEDNSCNTDCYSQFMFHKSCFDVNFDANLFIV